MHPSQEIRIGWLIQLPLPGDPHREVILDTAEKVARWKEIASGKVEFHDLQRKSIELAVLCGVKIADKYRRLAAGYPPSYQEELTLP